MRLKNNSTSFTTVYCWPSLSTPNCGNLRFKARLTRAVWAPAAHVSNLEDNTPVQFQSKKTLLMLWSTPEKHNVIDPTLCLLSVKIPWIDSEMHWRSKRRMPKLLIPRARKACKSSSIATVSSMKYGRTPATDWCLHVADVRPTRSQLNRLPSNSRYKSNFHSLMEFSKTAPLNSNAEWVWISWAGFNQQ